MAPVRLCHRWSCQARPTRSASECGRVILGRRRRRHDHRRAWSRRHHVRSSTAASCGSAPQGSAAGRRSLLTLGLAGQCEGTALVERRRRRTPKGVTRHDRPAACRRVSARADSLVLRVHQGFARHLRALRTRTHTQQHTGAAGSITVSSSRSLPGALVTESNRRPPPQAATRHQRPACSARSAILLRDKVWPDQQQKED